VGSGRPAGRDQRSRLRAAAGAEPIPVRAVSLTPPTPLPENSRPSQVPPVPR
jgi:hypothetical protein